jgi:hypothetical protein
MAADLNKKRNVGISRRPVPTSAVWRLFRQMNNQTDIQS